MNYQERLERLGYRCHSYRGQWRISDPSGWVGSWDTLEDAWGAVGPRCALCAVRAQVVGVHCSACYNDLADEEER